MMSPMGRATRPPTTMAARTGQPWLVASWDAVRPPTPAKVIWQSQIMPPSPVTRVKDKKMMP